MTDPLDRRFLAAYWGVEDAHEPRVVEIERDTIYAAQIHRSADPSRLHAITVPTEPLDGFELRIRRGEGASPRARLLPIDAGELIVDSNDELLAAAWLTAAARRAVLRTLAEAESDHRGLVNVHAANGAAAEVMVIPGNSDDGCVLAALDACVLLASRPAQLARELGDVLRDVPDAVSGARWGLGEDFAIIDRDGVHVVLRYERTWPGERGRAGRLHTSALVRRMSTSGDALAMWRREVPRSRPTIGRELRAMRAALPRLEDRYDMVATSRARSVERLAHVEEHVVVAEPVALVVGGEAITLWWDGMETEARRIDAAADLLVALVVDDARGDGPYR